jgi:hypothetical protein
MQHSIGQQHRAAASRSTLRATLVRLPSGPIA